MNSAKWYLNIFLYMLPITTYAIHEFLYPVGVIDHISTKKICVLYQKNSHLELWLWNPKTQEAVKGLLSSFTPAGLRVLPTRSAFSFIDNDRIRIKDLAKRSPRAIDLPYGPYDLSTIEWIDSQSFYFSAREREHFNLFHATIEGELHRITNSTTTHYMYPQKHKDQLFFVTKQENGTGTIECIDYPIEKVSEEHVLKKEFTKQIYDLLEEEEPPAKSLFEQKNSKVLFTNQDSEKEIAFLKIVSPGLGFFLLHPTLVSRHDTHMVFECYKLEERGDDWHTSSLFSFRVPLHLLMPVHNQEERLYESLLPLLPFYHDGILYYSHDTGDGLNLCMYNCVAEQNIQITAMHDLHYFFSPLLYQNKIYYGGTVCHGDGLEHISPQMWINDQGEQRFTFPFFNKD